MKKYMLTCAMLCVVAFLGFSCDDDKDGSSRKTYHIGDFYEADGLKGVVFDVDDNGLHGLIVSLDETTAQWATEAAATVKTYADDDEDGLSNMATIMKISDWETLFPAFAWCGAKNTGGVTGWFLPAFEELADLYLAYAGNREAFNKILTDNGGTPLPLLTEADENYWSSSENRLTGKEGEAAFFDFSDQTIGFSDKINVFRVRAVHAF